MEIINIEARTFEAMMERFDSFVRKVEKLIDRSKNKEMDGWLDNQDVCFILNVNPNTLQYLRDKRKLAYTKFNRKMYYKPEDVERFINNLESQKDE
jgi:hypothetical protein